MRATRQRRAAALTAAVVAWIGCACAQEPPAPPRSEPVVGRPCDGCEAVFEGLPAELRSAARIAPVGEPGEPLRIEGTVYGPGGRAVAGIIVYAYQTDQRGIYPRGPGRGAAARHGRLRGWVETDELGHYRFDTVRPGAYPDSPEPAHVHMHVIEPGCCTYYLDSIHFEDDPRLSPAERAELATGRGGSGLVRPTRDAGGVWVVRRDIRLGEGVPGHPAETAGPPPGS